MMNFSGRSSVAMGLLAGSAVVIAFTPLAWVGGLMLLAGGGLFVSERLVAKSLALTAPKEQALLGSALMKIEDVRRQVSKCKFLEKVEREGTELAAMGDELLQISKHLRQILDQKFEVGEITHARYLGAIDATSLSIGNQMLERKNALERLNTRTVKDQEFAAAVSEEKTRLQTLHGALKELGQLHEALNKIVTKDGSQDQLQDRLEQIQELATRAQKYSKGSST